VTTGQSTVDAPSRRSLADRLVRHLLVIHDAEPRALVSLQGSMVLTAIRCVIMYALIPLLAPVVTWVGVVAGPASVVLSVVAIGLAVHSLRRVWLADYRHRWAYTAFIVVVVAVLVSVIAIDTRVLLAADGLDGVG